MKLPTPWNSVSSVVRPLAALAIIALALFVAIFLGLDFREAGLAGVPGANIAWLLTNIFAATLGGYAVSDVWREVDPA